MHTTSQKVETDTRTVPLQISRYTASSVVEREKLNETHVVTASDSPNTLNRTSLKLVNGRQDPSSERLRSHSRYRRVATASPFVYSLLREIAVAADMEPQRQEERREDADGGVDVKTTNASRSDRHSFMKLLRDGVQLKISHPSDSNLSDAGISPADEDDNTRRGSRRGSTEAGCAGITSGKSRSSSRAWHTLAWRDVYSTEPFFEETINGEPLRIKQLLQGELNGFGTGLTVWPAACVLLKHLDYRFAANSELRNQFVLELGSGTGAVGVAAAMLGAGRVVVTDVENVLFIMQANADLAREQALGGNQSPTNVEVESYMWGTQPSASIIPRDATDREYPNLILVSDCILPRLYPIEPLVDALALLSKSHTKILISYEHRYYEHFHPKQKFWELMSAQSFAIRVLDDDEYHPHYRADDIEIWELSRK